MGLLLEALLGAVFGSIVGGVRPKRDRDRPSPPMVRVEASGWHLAIVVALVTQGVIVAIGVAGACSYSLTMLNDDLLWLLGIILLPCAVMAFAAGLAVIGWLVRGVRRVRSRDATGRVHAGVAGAGGLLLAMLLLVVAPSSWVAIAVVPSLVAAAGAVTPGAWRERSSMSDLTSVSDG